MKKNRFFSAKKLLAVLVCSLTISLMLISLVSAYRFYHNYPKCMATSGGRTDYYSVQYACTKAADGDSVTGAPQNACASWLGGVGNPNRGTREAPVIVYAPSETAVVQVALWGMCTDRSDRAVRMLILTGTTGIHGTNIGLQECISKFENAACFTRTGNWGNPNSQTIPLDVAKFIQKIGNYEEGTTADGKKYFQRSDLMVDRYHSDDHSAGIDTSAIRIIIGEGEEEDDPNLCKSWAPVAYTESDENNGHTRIVVKARNTAGRFPKGDSGDWHHNNDDSNEFEHKDYLGPIYAMPTDNIEWRSCYYPGVQKTAESSVSDINDTIVAGGTDGKWKYDPNPLPTDECLGYNPKVGHMMLWKAYEGDKIGKDWQNKYTVSGDLGHASGGPDNDHFREGSYKEDHYGMNEVDITRTGNHGTGRLQFSDVGKILAETGKTGSPKDAVISDKTPDDVKIYENDGYCCGEAEGSECCSAEQAAEYIAEHPEYEDPQTCKRLICTNSYDNEILSAAVDDGTAKDTVNVIVPYNFKNSAGVEIERDRRKKTDKECDTEGEDCDDDSNVDFDSAYYPVFSGERVKLKRVWVEVGERYNQLTYATYSTVVPEATFRLFMYVSDKDGGGDFTTDDAKCSEISKAKQCVKIGDDVELEELNASGSLDGKIDSSADNTKVGKALKKEFIRSKDDDDNRINPYDAFDASAGDYLCFIAAVTPYTSGSDAATGDTAGDGQWRFGNPDCVAIYKRPTFQVWGGSLYSQKGVEGSVSKKRNFYYNYFSSKSNLCKGDTCFELHGDDVTYLTPWVEGALIINDGITTTVASGAATGYNGSLKIAGNPNGSFCKYRAPLSFSNGANTCTDMSPKATGMANIGSGVTNANRDNLIKYWIGDNSSEMPDDGNCTAGWIEGGNCKRIKSASGEAIRYIEGGNLKISKKVIDKNRTFLISATGDVNIKGNIKYKDEDDEPYTMLAEIPKVIIYAQNINISCKVEEVDAILITRSGGKVNTCSEYVKDSEEPNAEERSNQLKIFGTVMANKIYLGRTYGAAAWDGRKVPDDDGVKKTTDAEAAEVFDYDSTIPMWSEYMSGAVETDTLQIVYQHELAPRY